MVWAMYPYNALYAKQQKRRGKLSHRYRLTIDPQSPSPFSGPGITQLMTLCFYLFSLCVNVICVFTYSACLLACQGNSALLFIFYFPSFVINKSVAVAPSSSPLSSGSTCTQSI